MITDVDYKHFVDRLTDRIFYRYYFYRKKYYFNKRFGTTVFYSIWYVSLKVDVLKDF